MIPTAKKFRKLNTTTAFINSNKEAENCMIQFAKLHVTEALKQVSKKAYGLYFESAFDATPSIVNPTKESVINSYPLENIK